MQKIKSFLKNNMLVIIGAVIGAVGGYFYWLKVGCASGSCPITSSPLMSTVWGTVMGGLIFSLFNFKNKGQKTDNTEN